MRRDIGAEGVDAFLSKGVHDLLESRGRRGQQSWAIRARCVPARRSYDALRSKRPHPDIPKGDAATVELQPDAVAPGR